FGGADVLAIEPETDTATDGEQAQREQPLLRGLGRLAALLDRGIERVAVHCSLFDVARRVRGATPFDDVDHQQQRAYAGSRYPCEAKLAARIGRRCRVGWRR